MIFFKICCSDNDKQKPPQRKSNIRTIPNNQPNAKRYTKQPVSQPFNLADKYKGEQLNGVPNGNGQMMYKNGDYYRGQWIAGQKQGRGLQIYHQKSYKYEGEWKSNLQNGQGKVTFEDGSYFIGQFKDDNRHGKGEFHDLPNKKILEQYFENGLLIKQHLRQNVIQKSRQEQFPTLVLDKQRFNSQDLELFQGQNPQIKELSLQYLIKYYSICKLIKLNFMTKNIKQWNDKEVHEFLEAIGLQSCRQTFHKNKIKGRNLITVTQKQMKDDLKIKLGHRKRLLYYCKYLSALYNDDKKKKPSNKKTLDNRYRKGSNRSITSDLSQQKFITAFIDQQDIIQQQIEHGSQDEIYSSEKFISNIQVLKNRLEVNNEQNYNTSEWNQYNSQHVHSSNILCGNEQSNDILKSDGSGSAWRSNKSAGEQSLGRNASGVKKSSENTNQEKHGFQRSRVRSRRSHKSRAQKSGRQVDQKQNIDKSDASDHKKTNSQSQYCQQSSQDQPGFRRKKTTGHRCREGGMQIRQLYQFLRERGNLSFIIKTKQIQLLGLIGEGGYGKVYHGKYISCPVAVKDYIKTGRHQIQQDFLKQLQILSDLKHPNIVLYMGICITMEKYQLVTEYLENGSLFDQIHKKRTVFKRNQLLDIINDIVKGMVYLHNMKNILHRDLKSSNVLLDENWKVKLCDFGLSGHKKQKKKNNGRIGTYQWMAPEVMKKQEMDYFSDVYSFGVIIWQLLTYKIPYQGYTEQQIIGEVGYDENYKLKLDQDNTLWQVDDFIVLLMNECLNRIPSERPTFIQIQSKLNNYFDKIEAING